MNRQPPPAITESLTFDVESFVDGKREPFGPDGRQDADVTREVDRLEDRFASASKVKIHGQWTQKFRSLPLVRFHVPTDNIVLMTIQ